MLHATSWRPVRSRSRRRLTMIFRRRRCRNPIPWQTSIGCCTSCTAASSMTTRSTPCARFSNTMANMPSHRAYATPSTLLSFARQPRCWKNSLPGVAAAYLYDGTRMRPTRDSRRTLLLVDDEPSNLQVLRHTLQNEYRLLFAKDGNSALELLRADRPDLILLDVMMPGLSGYEVCKQIKQDAWTAAIPVIFV